jgi:hypothetical protein
MRNLGPRLVMAAVGLALIAGGLALAVNFRDAAAWHARRSIESARWLERPLRHVPPWKELLQQPLDQRIARQLALTRLIGGAFAGFGVLLLITAVVAHNFTTS